MNQNENRSQKNGFQFSVQNWTILTELDNLDRIEQFGQNWTLEKTLEYLGQNGTMWTKLDIMDIIGHYWTLWT